MCKCTFTISGTFKKDNNVMLCVPQSVALAYFNSGITVHCMMGDGSYPEAKSVDDLTTGVFAIELGRY